jgi:hypothetical protein
MRSNNVWETHRTHKHIFLVVLCGASEPDPVLGWPCLVGWPALWGQGDLFQYWVGAGDPDMSHGTLTTSFGGWVFIPLHHLFFNLPTSTPSTPPWAQIPLSQLPLKPVGELGKTLEPSKRRTAEIHGTSSWKWWYDEILVCFGCFTSHWTKNVKVMAELGPCVWVFQPVSGCVILAEFGNHEPVKLWNH